MLAEINCLLKIIEEILPIGPNDWDRVTERHCSYYPGNGRTCDTLKRKFSSLYNHKKPTGDPNCPPYVRQAKRIRNLIKAEMDVSDGEGLGDNGAADDLDEEDIPLNPPIDDVNQDIQNEVGEDITESSLGVATSPHGGGGNRNPLTGASIASARICTPRNQRNSGTSPTSQFYDLMQFMLMRSESEGKQEQQRRQEREELEDRRRQEREETKDKNHCE